MPRPALRPALIVLLVALVACTAAPLPPPPVVPMAHVAQQEPEPSAQVREYEDQGADEGGDSGPIPVTSADPVWGSRAAPVTLVVFSEFQCPFCSRVAATLMDLRRDYGPGQLRIVFKHTPLPFHQHARPAAIAGATVQRLGGSQAFWTFHDLAFANQRNLGPEEYERWAGEAGIDGNRFRAAFDGGLFGIKVDEDLALGKKIGVTGTPASFVNGVFLSGAQPIEKFREVIDAQLAAARALVAEGVAPSRVYARLAADNHAKAPPPAPAPSKKVDDDPAPWQVPVGKSPVRGKATALVTMMMFADYQCPFCARAEATVDKLEAEYGDKLRVVFKHNPLPFHPRAEPAAQLALEARAQKGDKAFWAVNDLLWIQAGKLEDQDLEGVAKAAGLDTRRALAAIAQHKHKATIQEDTALADDVHANGTPHFFINGRRLVGAQPIEKFREVIEEQLKLAQAALARGVSPAKLYEALQKDAKTPPPPEKKQVPVPTAQNPSKGKATAKVTVQIFADFQCPFCKRANPTLAELDAAFPGKLRFVWRHLPLAFHKNAEPAAEAAMEAYRQLGAPGFWKMHDLLFEAQGQPDALARPSLDQMAASLGLDMQAFAAALDHSMHRAAIEADAKVAADAGISGTPGFVINGYFLSGAQPLGKFKRIVQRALAEAK